MQLNKRAFWSLFVGVTLAAFAVVGVNRMLGERPQGEAPFKVVSIVVAARDLDFGSTLDAMALSAREWPAESVPQGSFATVAEILGDGRDPRVVLKPLVEGEPVLTSKISGFGTRATMSSVLPEGKRAFSVRVNDVSGVSGFLLPGDRVDVLLTRQLDSKDNSKLDQATDVILQNVVVRAIDQLADEDRNKPQVVKAVTLEVTPEDAQKLALAQQVGQISLSLRNVATNGTADTRSIRLSDLINEPQRQPQAPQVATPKPARSQPQPPMVIVRHGLKSESVVFSR